MSHKYYYDCLPMEIWQECWKFKAYQEIRNDRLIKKKTLIRIRKAATRRRELEESRVKSEDRTFYDRQDLAELEINELNAQIYEENWQVEKGTSFYKDHLHASWKGWLFYHTPIHFQPKKKIRLK